MLHLPILTLGYLSLRAAALEVTNGSSCFSVCNGPGGTPVSALTCNDGGYTSTTAGAAMRSCLTCEMNSTEDASQTDNDVYWFLFNMKYTIQTCVFDNTANTAAIPSCTNACAPLKPLYDTLWLTPPQAAQYDYCSINNTAFVQSGADCASCLQTFSGSVILGNFVNIMLEACQSKPDASQGQTVAFQRDLFDSSTLVSSSTSSASSAATTSSSASASGTTSAGGSSSAAGAGTTSTASPSSTSSPSKGLSSGALAGIGIACGLAGLAAIVGIVWFIFRRRRHARAYNSGRLLQVPPSCQEHSQDSQDSQDNKKDLIQSPARPTTGQAGRSQLGGHEYYEMDGRERQASGRSPHPGPSEMEGSDARTTVSDR